MTFSVGFKWIALQYNIKLIWRFRVQSQIAPSRIIKIEDGYIQEFFLPSAKPEDTLAGHLSFALKHEGVNLELLSRLFSLPIDSGVVADLENWIGCEPTGQYSRRACFFYEWLTGKMLSYPGVTSGNYVDALDEDLYFTGESKNNTRWRVRDNLPGNKEYCPLVFRTEYIRKAEEYNLAEKLTGLEAEFGTDTLMRSAVWLSVRESRASFAIEHEETHNDRIRRFAAVMEKRCGYFENPLDDESLCELQSEILGRSALRYGLRKSPIFIGEISNYTEVIHYIAPHWNDIPAMMEGLNEFAQRTKGKSSIIRAAVLSFGFVYIHPMSDGNGRISRFLINDTFRRDGAVPSPYILPVSSAITRSAVYRRSYDQILETFSKSFINQYKNNYRFGNDQVAEDGVHYNLEFEKYEDALHCWRYPDLTDHAIYLYELTDRTIHQEMREEARYLQNLFMARSAVKEILEGPDADIDRIIRSVRENHGQISNKLISEFPHLSDESIADKISNVVKGIYGD
jgi:hypothetical protein